MVPVVKCLFCAKLADRFCDAMIGFQASDCTRKPNGDVDQLLLGEPSGWTCDAPMCFDHCKQVGWICAGDDSDSIDHCSYHLKNTGDLDKNLAMFEREAEAKRRQVHAEIRRSAMKAES